MIKYIFYPLIIVSAIISNYNFPLNVSDGLPVEVEIVEHAIEAVPIVKVGSEGLIHRFHDTSPISPSGKYIALFRLPFQDRYPKPGEFGTVVLIDLESGEEREIAKSFGWEMQLGANVQWGKNDNQLFYNQVDTTNWDSFTVQYNMETQEEKRINGGLFMASINGEKLVSHNLRNSEYAQSGYGVIVPNEYRSKNFGLSSDDGIYVTDVKSGKSKLIASIKEIYENTKPGLGINNPEDFEIYCFKAMWNLQMTRIMTCVLLKPISGGKRKVAVVTMNADGSDIRTAITTTQYGKGGHHMAWLPDGDYLSINLEVDDRKEGLEIVTVKYDGSDLKEVFAPGSGHPSFHPGGLPFIITDAYAKETRVTDGDGYVPVRLLNVRTGKELVITKVKTPDVEDSSFRLDAHPAWDRSGRFVVFNGFDGDVRSVYVADLSKIIDQEKKHLNK